MWHQWSRSCFAALGRTRSIAMEHLWLCLLAMYVWLQIRSVAGPRRSGESTWRTRLGLPKCSASKLLGAKLFALQDLVPTFQPHLPTKVICFQASSSPCLFEHLLLGCDELLLMGGYGIESCDSTAKVPKKTVWYQNQLSMLYSLYSWHGRFAAIPLFPCRTGDSHM